MTDNDGGPAWPTFIAISPSGDAYPGFSGMSLRDYFAAAALTGILSCREQYLAVLADRKEAFPEEAIALECGRLADAMLKAREGKS